MRIDKRPTLTRDLLIYNHFEVLKGLVTKTGLVRTMRHFYLNNDQAKQANYQIFDSTPTSFLVP